MNFKTELKKNITYALFFVRLDLQSSLCYFLSTATDIAYLFCSISFGGERILRLSESKENVFSLPNVSKMPKGNGTQRKAADGPARLKINVVH